MSPFTIIIFLFLTLLLNCLVLSYAVFVLWKRIGTLEKTLSTMQSGTATKDARQENIISFILLTLLSTQQGLNLLFSLLSHRHQVGTLSEPHKEEMKIH